MAQEKVTFIYIIKSNPSSTIVLRRFDFRFIRSQTMYQWITFYMYVRTSGFAPIFTFSTLIFKTFFFFLQIVLKPLLWYILVTNNSFCNKIQVRHNVDLPSKRFNSHFHLTSIYDLLLSVPRFYLSCILRFIVSCLNGFFKKMNIAGT